MKLDIRPANRWCVVQKRSTLNLRVIQTEILAQDFREGEFTTIGAPLPARDPAPFRVYHDEKELLVAIAVYDSTNRPALPGGKNPPESVQIFFDPRHDHLGFFQFSIEEGGGHLALTHLPYPEAHSTAFPHIELKSVESRREKFSGSYSGWSCHWVFAHFALAEVFRHGSVVGFNICRSRLRTSEDSSWNFCSGAGFQDAEGFGHLHRTKPALELNRVCAQFDRRTMRVQGRASGQMRDLELEIATPLDERHVTHVKIRDGTWQGRLRLDSVPTGRYRLYPRVEGKG